MVFRLANEMEDGPPAAFRPAPAPASGVCSDLLELFTGVTDGRPGQGRDHPVAAVLALAAAAVVAGSRSFTAIAGWAADVPAGVLEDLYRRRAARCRAAVESHDLAGGYRRWRRCFRRGDRRLADGAGTRRRGPGQRR
jgi:hypothetical protein